MSFLHGEIKKTEDVSDEEILYIFETLYQNYYDGVDSEYFLRNFRARDFALVFGNSDGIKGFSLQEVIPVTVGDKVVIVLWAGDILIHPDFWGKNDYRVKLAELCLRLFRENPSKLVYRLTTPKGYKTYRVVKKLFHRFYPSPGFDYYPEFESKVIDAILTYKYPPRRYQPEKKLLVADENDHRLAAGFAQITPDMLSDPYIRCFYSRNPGYAKGNEIPVISQITPDNLKEQKVFNRELINQSDQAQLQTPIRR